MPAAAPRAWPAAPGLCPPPATCRWATCCAASTKSPGSSQASCASCTTRRASPLRAARRWWTAARAKSRSSRRASMKTSSGAGAALWTGACSPPRPPHSTSLRWGRPARQTWRGISGSAGSTKGRRNTLAGRPRARAPPGPSAAWCRRPTPRCRVRGRELRSLQRQLAAASRANRSLPPACRPSPPKALGYGTGTVKFVKQPTNLADPAYRLLCACWGATLPRTSAGRQRRSLHARMLRTRCQPAPTCSQ